ncbi:MAG: AbrB/MazE/SpoVT family DNA-binding domain-containing protein [Vicinamibacteria bacterium]
MATATVTSKGQITIPKEIRERLRIKTGDRLDFRVEDGVVWVVPLARKVAEVYGAFASKARRPLSTKEMKRRLGRAFKEGRL